MQERETPELWDTGECHSHASLESSFASGFTFANKPACKQHAYKSRDCPETSPLNVQPQQDKLKADSGTYRAWQPPSYPSWANTQDF